MATAAVLLKLLPRRRASLPDVEKPDAFAAALRDLQESPPITAISPLDVDETKDVKSECAAQKIQRVWRGHLLRKVLSKIILRESMLAGPAIQQSLDLLLDWYEGWIIQLVTLGLLVLCIVTAYYQVFGQLPSAFDSNSSFMNRVNQYDRTGIVNSAGLYPLIKEMVDDFSNQIQVEIAPGCAQALETLCPFNQTQLDEFYGGSMQDLLANVDLYCPKISTNSGYVDSSRRIVGTMYVTQTRRKTTPCATKLLEIDPYQGTSLPCLSLDEEDLEFSPPPPSSCATCSQFVVDPDHKLFALAFSGSAFNLPTDFVKCRVDELESRQWLDARSKNISDVRAVTSVALYANGYTVGAALTITSLICIVLHQLTIIRQYVVNRRKLLSPLFIFVFAGAVIEIAAHSMYLSQVTIASQFNFTKTIQSEMLFADRLALLDDFNYVLYLADQWRTFTSLCAVGIWFTLINTIICLEFHPSSAIVGGVVKQAASSLASFLFVYIVFILGYAFIGMILFSRTSTRFATFGGAINTLLMLAIGEIQEVEQSISDPTHTTSAAVLQTIYFWVYIALMTILLMNILLAIIVGAFVELTERANRASPMHSLGRSFVESVLLAMEGAGIHLKRAFGWHGVANGGRERLKTPKERLLLIRKLYRSEGTSAMALRAELVNILYFSKSTELVLNRCRMLTNYQNFKPKELYLRGMDANSAALKGHSLGLLESIVQRQNELLSGQQELQTQHKQLIRALQKAGVVPAFISRDSSFRPIDRESSDKE
ncbi:hypothetical protein BASA81_003296 [Batrachochytrium salamandrivorans]|nr:hypothetical protein BASA81_003296 [Batrachochytrium salamandrivorans]